MIFNVSHLCLTATAIVARNRRRTKSFLTRAQRLQMCALVSTSLPPVSKELFLCGVEMHIKFAHITNIVEPERRCDG